MVLLDRLSQLERIIGHHGRLLRFTGIAAVGVFLFLVLRFWHPIYGFTYFFELGSIREGRTIAAFREHPVYMHPQSSGYDGQYYAQIAHHPTLVAPELRPSIDAVAYRSRKILVPAAAWLLGAGRPAWIITVYSLLNVACWLMLAALLWRLFEVSDCRSWIAWFGVLFSAGALMSVRYALIDLPSLLLVTGAIYAADRRRTGAALGWLMAAALARESSLAAWPTVWTGPARSPRAVIRNGLRVLLAATPLAAWIAYVTWMAGRSDLGDGNFALPAAGFVDNWRGRLDSFITLGDRPVAWATAAATFALLAQFAFVVTRWRPSDLAWRTGAMFALLMLVLGGPMWDGYPSSAMRVLLPLNVVVNMIALRSRAPLAWLLACNLTVLAGLFTMRDVPRDPREVATAQQRGVASIMELGDGWYGWEHAAAPPWGSTAVPGRVTVRAWPQSADVHLLLTFALQSPRTSIATISAGGSMLWRGQLPEGSRVPLVLPITVSGGKLDLDVKTETPLEPANASGERVGLAMFDPRLQIMSR